MDFAHLTYAVALLIMAGTCAFMARNKQADSNKWGLLGTHATFLLCLEALRIARYSFRDLQNVDTLPDALLAAGIGLTLCEFARAVLQEKTGRGPGRWTTALPVMGMALILALCGEKAMTTAVWLGIILPAGILSAWLVALNGTRRMRLAGAAMAFHVICMVTAGLFGVREEPLLIWGWLPALPLATLSATLLCAALWHVYLGAMPESIAKARPSRFNVNILAGLILLCLFAGHSAAKMSGRDFLEEFNAVLKEDTLHMAAEVERMMAGLQMEKDGAPLKFKAALDNLHTARSTANCARLIACNQSKLSVFAKSNACASKEEIDHDATAQLRGAIELISKRTGPTRTFGPYNGKNGKWMGVMAPLKAKGPQGERLLLELRLSANDYNTCVCKAKLPPLLTSFMLICLALAFFAVARMNFESQAELLSSEKDRELALWGADIGTWTLDIKRGLLKTSTRCMEMLGYPPERCLWALDEWKGIIHPDDIDNVFTRFHSHVSEGAGSFESKHRVRKADGGWTWILAKGRISAQGPDGTPTEAAGTHMDINGLKEAEQELLQSKLRMESAQRIAGLGLWELDLAASALKWNDQAATLIGLAHDAPHSRETLPAMVAPEDLEKLKKACDRCVATGEPMAGGICRITLQDGTVKHLNGEGRLVRDSAGKPARIEGIVFDISGFIMAEQAIQRNEEEARTLLENIDDIIFRIGRDMKINYMSLSMSRYAPVDPKAIVGLSLREAGFGGVCEFWEASLKACFNNALPLEREFTLDTPHGPRLFNWRLFPEPARDGSIKSVLSIARDVTKRREAETAFRDIFTNMLEGFAMCEAIAGPKGPCADFKILAVNPAFERLTGLNAALLLNRKASEALPGIGRDWLDVFAEALEGRSPGHVEREIAGTGRRFEISAYKSAAGKFAMILYDITERNKAVTALQRQMRLIKAILDGIPDMLTLMRPDHSIVACNKAARACTGWEGEDFKDCHCHNLLGMARPCGGSCACDEAAERRTQVVKHVESIETGRSYEIRAIPILAAQEDGSPELVVELIRDTTEKNYMEKDLDRTIDTLQAEILQRMNAEEALSRSEKLHRMITEAAQVGIWQIEPDGRIKYLNPRMRELLEVDADRPMEGRLRADFLPKGGFDLMDAAKRSGESVLHSCEAELTGALGAKRNVLVSSVVLYLPDAKRLDAYIETFTDITELRRSEKEAELKNIKLMQAEKMASLGILVSGVAHEINNPTNFIMLNSPILHDVWKSSLAILDRRFKEEPSLKLAGLPYGEMRSLIPELFKSISDGAERIKNIVTGLKDYARQEISDPYAKTDVNDAVQAALVLLGNMIKKSTRKFKVSYGADLPAVRGAKQKVEQIVINLVQNSCQALKSQNSALEIRTLHENGKVKIIVVDEGCGIPKENMPFLSDPFFTTKRDSGGTGLGLSITAGIVNDLGGEMTFASEPGAGTTVTVAFPPIKEPPAIPEV